MNLNIEPTIDDIRKMGNDRRPKIVKPPPPKKITKKKVKEPEPIIEPEPEPEPEPELLEEDEESESDEEVYIPPPKKNSKKVKDKTYIIQDFIKDPKNKDVDFELLFENITDIKNLINQQKNVIEDAIKPKVEEPKSKSKSKPKPKPKVKKQIVPKGKSLDLTVSDKEVEQLTSNNTAVAKQPVVDEKLQAFLNAFKK